MFFNLLAESTGSSIIEYISNNFWDMVSILCSVIVVVFGFVVAVVRGHSKRKFFNIYADKCLGLSKDNEQLSRAYYRFKHYTSHTLTNRTNIDDINAANNIPYRKFCKLIQNNKITVITGSSGIGKSILMQKIAYKFRSKKRGKSFDEIKDYGIIFYGKKDYTFLKDNTKGQKTIMQALLEDIDEKCKDATTYSIYIDGLDELLLLESTDEEDKCNNDIIKEFFKSINKRTKNCKRFVISLRPEVVATQSDGEYIGRNIFHDYDNLHKSGTQLWEVDRFIIKKVMRMYKKESHLSREPLIQRYQNVKKLNAFFNNKINENTVFSFPFIITWLPEIFKETSESDLINCTWYDVLKLIVDNNAERELEISDDEFENPEKENFIDEFHKTVTKIALFMGENKAEALTANDVDRTCGSASTDIRKVMEVLSHRLLVATETTEGQKYEFIHNLIYWYVLANALADVNYDCKKRIEILNQYSSTPLEELYYRALWTKHKECFSNYTAMSQDNAKRAENEFMQAVKNKNITANSAQNISHAALLKMLYGLDEITLDGIEYDSGGTVLKRYPVNKTDTATYIMPDCVTEIAKDAFIYCDNLKNITIGKGIGIINEKAFESLTCLETVVIPDNVTTIEKQAFLRCTGLKEVTLGNGLQTIGFQAFGGCPSLESIVIPDNVTTIEKQAFAKCTALKKIIIGSGVKTIKGSIFLWCEKLSGVYYHGNKEEWNKIAIDEMNESLLQAKKYYYSDNQPDCTDNENYWHYGENGEVLVWGEETLNSD